MTEPLARQRIGLGDAREIRPGSAYSSAEDPLAELARLVGRDDPFRDIFPARQKARAAEAEQALPPRHEAGGDYADPYAAPGVDPDGTAAMPDYVPSYRGTEPSHGAQPLYDAPHDAFEAPGRELQVPRDSLRFPALSAPRDEDTDGHHLRFEPSETQDDAPPLHADLWAEGVPDASAAPAGDYPATEDGFDDAEPAGHGRRRTMVVLAAVVALTAGGLGATFLVRGGSSHTVQSGTAPTIMADQAPTKVQPPETSNASTGGDGTTALLEKSASDNVANAKVVNAQERPVDLAQLPQASSTSSAGTRSVASAQTAASPFPEPKKVKTILIRPDGSVVGESPAAAPVVAAADPAVAIPDQGVVMPSAATPVAEAPAAPAPVPKPATPKASARASATPKSAPAHPAAKPKPVETADATPTATTAADQPATASPAGGYAVQLAAPPSEQEAKSVSARLQKKFTDELAGRKPSIHKADSGNKSVYRVRVGNLSQDDAKSLCTKLQANGGSCFVVHN